jgi:hypothetical protein
MGGLWHSADYFVILASLRYVSLKLPFIGNVVEFLD